MQRALFRKIIFGGLSLGVIGTLIAYADSAGSLTPETLTAEGKITPRTRAVISGEYAYLLGQTETVIADAKVDSLAASPAGEEVLVAAHKRRPFRGIALSSADTDPATRELNLVYWEVRTRTSRVLLRETTSAGMEAEIEQILWLPRTRIALVVLNRFAHSAAQPETATQTLYRVDAATGTVKRLADQYGTGYPTSLEVSPSQSLAYDIVANPSEPKPSPSMRCLLRVYDSRGLRSSTPLDGYFMSSGWLSDGKSIYAEIIGEEDAEGKHKFRKQLTIINLETGAVTQPDKLPVALKAEKPTETLSSRDSWAVDAVTMKAALTDFLGKSQAASVLWLQATGASVPRKESVATVPSQSQGPVWASSLLIATNAHLETRLATENTAAILFTRDGSLCAAPVFRVPAMAFEQALRGIQRTATMSSAKQIGLAVMMYAQDYDENLPQLGSGVQDAVGPYLKNPSVFENPGTGENGFTYSYSGPTGFGQMGQPATTQLGFVSGPGGRAVIWADGHVTWQDAP